MFDFLKKKKSDSIDIVESSEERRKQEKEYSRMYAGYTATQAAKIMTEEAKKTFAKPDSYTGNRKFYDSGVAKLNAKKKLFESGNKVIDPYTKDRLFLTKNEAKILYGEDWTKHIAESDHVKPLEQVYNDTKGNVWNTTDDIKAAANSDDNIRVASRKYNNPKRSRINKDYVRDNEYLKSKGVKLTKEGKLQAIKDGELAEQSINRQLKISALKNIANIGHEAGKYCAKNAGDTALTTSVIKNIVSVIKGEKNSEEAIADSIKDGGKAAVTGYAMGAGLTVVSHSLSNSSSKFIQGLVKSNIPGKVITSVLVTGDALKKWGEGEITTQECLIELGDKGLNMATMGYSMALGQALIPIPIVGGAVGSLVGSMLMNTYYNNLINTLQKKEMEHHQRMCIIAECYAVAEQTKAFRKEFESYLDSYFQEYRECFDTALASIQFTYQLGDADGMISSANKISRKLGGKIHYETVEEFKSFIDDDSVDIF